MSRRKGERTAKMNERDYPYVVEYVLPNDFKERGHWVEGIVLFHLTRNIPEMRGQGRREEGTEIYRQCFASREYAEQFAMMFLGKLVSLN